MPVTPVLPYQWYDTPNIHLCTLRDFEDMAAETGLSVKRRVLVGPGGEAETGLPRLVPNLLATGAVYSLEG